VKKIKIISIFLLMFVPMTIYAQDDICYSSSKFIKNTSETNYVPYQTALKNLYNDWGGTTDPKTFSIIKCSKHMAIKSTGAIKDSVLAGVGFDYEVTVIIKNVCRALFEYNLFNKEYKNNSNARKPMDAELKELYPKWTTKEGYEENYFVSANDIEVIFDDVDNQKYQNINSGFVLDQSKTKKYVNTHKTETGKAQGTTVTLWSKTFTTEYTFIPSAKKTIINTERYGEVILDSTPCPVNENYCTNSDNKIYTDFSAGYGNYKFKVTVNYKPNDWTIESNCGYNIYNKGGSSSLDRINFRQISLTNPFPTGNIGSNWKDYKSKKLITGEEYNKSPVYIINLNRESISAIRAYNNNLKKDYLDYASSSYQKIDTNNYSSNNKFKSSFIDNYVVRVGD